MKIYVEVIAYNEEVMIAECLKSVYDYVDEIIVVDGSQWSPSTDRTCEIAQSVGPKVKIFSGVFIGENGWDHLGAERKFGVEQMEKSEDNWCISHDADEVFKQSSIERLTTKLRNNQFKGTWLISYPHTDFWVDKYHISNGFPWDRMRSVGTFRLLPGVTWLNYHRVGFETNRLNFESLTSPKRVILKDSSYYHYGYAASIEKYREKSLFYFLRDISFRKGYKEDEWEKFWNEIEIPKWEKRLESDKIEKYNGPWK
jgi:glycosyltransferase involved in cell wall biosynthesis